MTPALSPASASQWLWRTLTSLRFTLLVLLTLALVAILGTLVPQGEPPAYYLERFGTTFGALLWRLGLANLYSGAWLLVPVSMLALNLLACLVKGLPQALRRAMTPLTWQAAEALPLRGRFIWPPEMKSSEVVAKVWRAELGRSQRLSLPGKEIFFCEKGRFRPLGPYLIHFGLLLVLWGALVGKLWGVEGKLVVHEGELAERFETLRPLTERVLPFQVRLERFQVNYYPQSGIPAEFRADLTFLRHGQEKKRAVCRVNEPVTFDGWTFYQSSYGAEPSGPLGFEICQGNLCHRLEAPVRHRVELPGGGAQFLIIKVEGNLQGLGPAVQMAFRDGPGHPRIFWVSLNHPQLADQPDSPFAQPAGYRFTLTSLPYRWYSVFQVKQDPGVWYVYSGFLLFLPGLFMAFFLRPQKWAVVLEKTPTGDKAGRLLGASPRAREAFEVRRERLLRRLQQGARE